MKRIAEKLTDFLLNGVAASILVGGNILIFAIEFFRQFSQPTKPKTYGIYSNSTHRRKFMQRS